MAKPRELFTDAENRQRAEHWKRAIRRGGKVDALVSVVWPGLAARRAKSRLHAFSYDAATDRRYRRTFTNTAGSADDHYDASDRIKVINKCRELERNYPLVAGIYTTMANNITGTSFRIQARTKDIAWNTDAEQMFAEWSADKKSVDYEGRFNLLRYARMVMRSVIRDGDIIVLKINEGEGKLQAVEADRVVTPGNMRSDGNVRHGIRFDGAPAAYYVSDTHSASGYEYGTASGSWKDAKYVFHPYAAERFGQSRGIPVLVASIDTLQDIHEFLRFELYGQKLASSVGLIFKMPGAQQFAAATGTETEDDGGNDRLENPIAPMMQINARPGEDVETMKHDRPGDNFEGFLETMLRFAGRPTAMPLELIMLHFSRSNFSNTRQAIIEARNGFRVWRNDVLIPDFLRPVYRWKVGWWARPGGPLYPAPDDFLRHEIHIAGWDWLDPMKDVQADGIAVDRGFMTLAEVCAKRGLDKDEVLRAKAEDIAAAMKYASEHGIEDYHEVLPNVLARKPR